MSGKKKLITTTGCPVADNQKVTTAGPRDPMLLQDFWFLEKLAHIGNCPKAAPAYGEAWPRHWRYH